MSRLSALRVELMKRRLLEGNHVIKSMLGKQPPGNNGGKRCLNGLEERATSRLAGHSFLVLEDSKHW